MKSLLIFTKITYIFRLWKRDSCKQEVIFLFLDSPIPLFRNKFLSIFLKKQIGICVKLLPESYTFHFR